MLPWPEWRAFKLMLELLCLVSVVKLRGKGATKNSGVGKSNGVVRGKKVMKKNGLEGAKSRLIVLTEFQIK